MEKEFDFLDIVKVKKDYVFKEADGVMHCKKGTQGRIIGINDSPKGVYYDVEFFDTSEIDDPVFFFSKDELELVMTNEEEQAEYLRDHPEHINDEKWLKANGFDIDKIKEIWSRKNKNGKKN